ncbi:MAG: TetR/AcrR family transcriptional regulator [Oscillospiraceae bacterium]|nr:TetR/AcrR family transcriptional regulator [Oscillospiraceae bacterium]
MKKLTRVQQAEATRKKLFDAAYSLLDETEFDTITINGIVSKAGVSAGTFYLYFKSKLDVYYQTYRLADKYFADVVAPMLDKPSALDNLLLFFENYAYYNARHTSLRLTKLLYNADNTCFIRDADPGMLSVLRNVVERGLASGELDQSMGADEIVRFLMRAVRGLVYDWCIRDGGFDLKEAMRDYVMRLYRAVAA